MKEGLKNMSQVSQHCSVFFLFLVKLEQNMAKISSPVVPKTSEANLLLDYVHNVAMYLLK